ncbi:glycoside hydrolase family 3 N-terminal domain-containing protein [Butyrivibrio sp. MC2013]|uniref:glycoside hydrolase family 3 N-terminal domain-containing protein n=1 Tax=Butyrivibrio sp. MC2013 TaxID=1280686 RepID=UPI00041F918C|nr:glycoside hydrolase family 3 N-terminal domain-containing protein [Butyrivibrio sp. MC2013]
MKLKELITKSKGQKSLAFRAAAFGAALMIAAGQTGCSAPAKEAPDSEEEAVETAEETPEETAEESSGTEAEETTVSEADTSVYMDASQDIETRVAALLSQMTVEEKAGQMIQAEQAALSAGDVATYALGSVLSGGGSAPRTGNMTEDWAARVNELKDEALETRLAIPLIYGSDCVHGNSNIYGTTIFPHNIGMGAAGDAELMEEYGKIVAAETRCDGIRWIFAPTLGNPQNELWGRSYEGFSERAEDIAPLAAAFVKGAQAGMTPGEYMDQNGVIATAKHFIGEGYTEGGRNQGDVVMDEDEFEDLLQNTLIIPYKAAVDAGARTVMASYNSVNGLKCHENGHILTDVLKGQLGFTGYVIGDYNGVAQVSGKNYAEKIANAVNAGVDMLMEPNDWKQVLGYLIDDINDGSISQERLDDAVTRILRVKFEAGLFEEKDHMDLEDSLKESVGSAEHREVAARAVRESLVLLKNDKISDKTVIESLGDMTDIAVVGAKANDMGSQCGGWTISWQGQQGNCTQGTTLIAGFVEATKAKGSKFYYSANGSQIDPASQAVIAVVGESPYAETAGDRSASTLAIDGVDRVALDNMFEQLESQNMDIPVIIILLTGRPVAIDEYVDKADAIVEAWFPGTEGEGVGQVLFGEEDFTGTLTYTWPWYPAGIEQKHEDPSVVLFNYGTGLRKDGSSIKEEGTAVIGEKPAKPEENAGPEVGYIDLSTCDYTVEGENFLPDSYLVTTGSANNISYADSFDGEWANAKWDIYLPESGNYTVHFIVASDGASGSMEIYYDSPSITDDGAAKKKLVPITATQSMTDYQDIPVTLMLEKGNYEFKLMNTKEGGPDVRLDCIRFENAG